MNWAVWNVVRITKGIWKLGLNNVWSVGVQLDRPGESYNMLHIVFDQMFSVKVCNLRPNHLDQGNRINVQILNIPLEYIMILIERIGFSRNAIKRFWLALRLSWCECLKMAEKESDKNVNATSWLVEPSLNDYSPYMNDIVQIICELFS